MQKFMTFYIVSDTDNNLIDIINSIKLNTDIDNYEILIYDTIDLHKIKGKFVTFINNDANKNSSYNCTMLKNIFDEIDDLNLDCVIYNSLISNDSYKIDVKNNDIVENEAIIFKTSYIKQFNVDKIDDLIKIGSLASYHSDVDYLFMKM